MGMNRLGFSEKEVWGMRFGKWVDLLETYKIVYNFETQRMLYGNPQPKEKKESERAVTPLSEL